VPLLSRLMLRVRRDGLWSSLRGIRGATRPETLEIYRIERLAAPAPTAGLEIQAGVEALRRLRQGTSLLPDEFYCEDRPGFVQCFCAVSDGLLAGIIWVLEGHNASRYIALREGEVELGYLHVLEAMRGRGIAKHLYWRAAVDCLSNGAQAVYAAIAAENHPSRKAAQAIGFKKIAEIRRTTLWGAKFRTESLHCPEQEASLGTRRAAVGDRSGEQQLGKYRVRTGERL
jgi:GNAT superfamily N-acetyltransferase